YSMSNVSIREGVMISHYEMLSDWAWYIRRGGNNRDTAMQFLLGWVPMLAPATPHIAEEFWHPVGGDGLLATHSLGESEHSSEDDVGILAREAYLKELISSGRGLRELAERHAEAEITRVVIQTSPVWKGELARESIRLDAEGFDFKAGGMDYLKSREVFADEQTRGEVMQTWMALTMGSKKKRGRIHTWSQGEKQLIMSAIDEASVINMNSDFIAHSLGVSSVEAYPAGEGEDVAGKARFAFPLEPGITFL
ncbi:MAG: class I tRNA ligase family protein, partial [Candidatus Thermoplasmatota archaeon]|nr:class I tRNA ligase family protein [Candidatus Thermoplasmatota archaeon]